ncbi:MAG: 2Fe-2S iron-sulfur cluster-binding protein [Deltaproteobacteria bacterium]|nr:2Fe-2S iron-sulfur cluster-binding protein [Deltaproteobacteria bacterium]
MADERVKVTIDGKEHEVQKGSNLLEACNAAGANVPFFCYHPGLSSPAVCRQCLVEVKGAPKPVPSCYTQCTDGMVVETKSEKALDVRRQMLEFTLVNHPIDCPICDKAGECMLQQQYFDWDGKYARNEGIKYRKAKTVDIGKHIVLDQERCILCTRCIRVCDEVAKAPELTMAKRGSSEVLTTAPGKRLDNPYSLNTVDVCPVGALTSKDFRFQMRAWELESTPSVCTGCATGCNVEIHASRGQIYRMIPRDNAAVNKHWMCDEGRFTYKPVHQHRAAVPVVGGAPVAWDTALDEAGRRLKAVLQSEKDRVGVVFNANSTNEDLHVLARLAFDHLGIARAYVAGRDQGSSDDILISADKNCNTAGVRAIGGTKLKSLVDLASDVKSGAIAALIVVGDDGVLGSGGRDGLDALPLNQLETLIVLASHSGALTDSAHVVLPMALWAELNGTFTNKLGMVQRVHKAIDPAGDSLPGWEILCHLSRRLDAAIDFDSARAVFVEAKQKYSFMIGAEWGRVHLPIQLRFAASRG